jgi:hypothetical protein
MQREQSLIQCAGPRASCLRRCPPMRSCASVITGPTDPTSKRRGGLEGDRGLREDSGASVEQRRVALRSMSNRGKTNRGKTNRGDNPSAPTRLGGLVVPSSRRSRPTRGQRIPRDRSLANRRPPPLMSTELPTRTPRRRTPNSRECVSHMKRRSQGAIIGEPPSLPLAGSASKLSSPARAALGRIGAPSRPLARATRIEIEIARQSQHGSKASSLTRLRPHSPHTPQQTRPRPTRKACACEGRAKLWMMPAKSPHGASASLDSGRPREMSRIRERPSLCSSHRSV